MERTVIVEKLTDIFRNVFNDSSIELTDEMTANDVDKWDSLTHMLMILEVEETFNMKFKLKDLNKMKMVGNLISIIESKISDPGNS